MSNECVTLVRLSVYECVTLIHLSVHECVKIGLSVYLNAIPLVDCIVEVL